MLKPIALVVIGCLALVGVASLAGAASSAASKRRARPSVLAVLGPTVRVAPGRFAKAYARCPRGYYVTGGGAYAGAVTEIISSPIPNLRGWFVDGINASPADRTFQERADAVCVKGAPNLTLGSITAVRAMERQAENAFAARRSASTGR